MNNMKLPANCAILNENEKMDAVGGTAAQTAVKAVIAIGGALGLTGVAAVAAKGVLSIFGGNPGQWIQDSMTAGKNFIDASMAAGANFINCSVNAGQNFLDGLLGK